MQDKNETYRDTTNPLQMFKFVNALANQNGMHKAVKIWLNLGKAY